MNQNFIFNVIRELNIYLFSKTFSAKTSRSGNNVGQDNYTNDDIYITDENVVEKLINKLESDNNIGVIGPRIRLKHSDAPQGPIPYSNPSIF